ncbi:MAG: D-alanyl-D-alanine carboxypeptidase family protein [Nakamurella sp.]
MRAGLVAALLLAGCGSPESAAPTSTIVTTATVTATATATATVTAVRTATVTAVTTTTATSTAPAAGERPDADTPGPDGGTACAVDPAYRDEPTDGLADAVIAAWADARAAAAAVGITLCVNDGKRSRAQQQATFDDYVARYGQAAAEQYVLPPDSSAHVAGYAIDVQPSASAAWLEGTNGSWGFCRMYDNEIWHFEFAETFRLGCPPRRTAPAG